MKMGRHSPAKEQAPPLTRSFESRPPAPLKPTRPSAALLAQEYLQAKSSRRALAVREAPKQALREPTPYAKPI